MPGIQKDKAHQPKSDADHLRRSQVVNNLQRGNYKNAGAHLTTEARRGKKLFSGFLIEFFESHPEKRKKLMMKAIEYAEKGNARFLELIITLVEGPLKDKEPAGNTYNFNFMSDGDRERALSSVERIKRMADSIPVLPEITDGDTSEGQDVAGEDTPDAGAELSPDD